MSKAKVQSRSPLEADTRVSSLEDGVTLTLITSDEALNRSLSATLDERGCELQMRRRLDSLADVATDRRNDALLVDLRGLPVSARLEVGRQLRLAKTRSTIPLIGLCDARMSSDARIAALADGFWDIVELPGGAVELLAKLGNWMGMKRNVDGLQSAMLLDVETGHYTAQGMKRRLREVVALAQRTGAPLSCVVFAGDPPASESQPAAEAVAEVARKFSLALHHGTRNSDIVGRLEPLKFVVLAPTTPLSGGVRLAERFTSLSWSRRVEGDYAVTFSAGVAGTDGRNGQIQACPELLLAAAVRALNGARAAGFAQVHSAWGLEETNGRNGR